MWGRSEHRELYDCTVSCPPMLALAEVAESRRPQGVVLQGDALPTCVSLTFERHSKAVGIIFISGS